MERLLRIPEVAARLSLSRTTVYELMTRGELPSVAVGGTRTRRIREADLDAWIQAQTDGTAPTVRTGAAQEVERADRSTTASAS